MMLSQNVYSIEIINNFKNELNLDAIAPNRYSELFLLDIIHVTLSQGLTSSNIMDEVKHLEGLSNFTRTGAPKQFKHDTLKRFHHKHFHDACFMPHNINNYYRNEKRINNFIDKLAKIESGNIPFEVCSDFVQEAMNVRKLTGEWIIYQIYKGKNYYLSLASHNINDDEFIYNRISTHCSTQFPFLFES